MPVLNKNTKHKNATLLEFDPLNRIDFNIKDDADIKKALKEALTFLATHHVDTINLYAGDYLFVLKDEDASAEDLYKNYLKNTLAKQKQLKKTKTIPKIAQH